MKPSIVDFAAALVRRQNLSLLELEDYYEVKINHCEAKATESGACGEVKAKRYQEKRIDSAIVMQRGIRKELGSANYFHSLF